MKLGKKIVSLMIVLVMIATTIFGINISNAVALTNEQKAQELVSKMTLEEKKEQVKNFRPIDDTFFEVLADDIGVCQEMLRIILEDEKLIVKDVIVQSSERNLYGRSVRLDALCILGNRKKTT